MSITPRNHLSRRALLGLGATVAAGAALGGCSSSGAGSRGTTAAGAGTVPAALPAKALDGTKVSSIANVPIVQTIYPRNPAATVSGPPGRGGVISTFQISFTPPAPPASQNKWLAEYQRKLNTTVKPTLVAPGDLAAKTQAVIAGGDLPDIFFLNLDQVPAATSAVLQGAFLDLTPYIGGDKVNDYPHLGGIQPVSWQNSLINGKLYGVPYPTVMINDGLPTIRADWQRKLGIADPKNADEMMAMFKAFVKNDPNGDGRADTWVWGAITEWDCRTALNMFGVPNQWRKNDDGTFTKHLETDEYRQAVEWLIEAREAGIFHPNAVSNGYSQSFELFKNGQLAVFGGGLMGLAWPTTVKGVSNWADQLWALFPVGHDGGEAQLWQGSATFGSFGIPAKLGKDEAKVRELLSILNYWSAPFGSAEYTFMNYGIEDHNWSWKDNSPTRSTDTTRLGEMAAQYVPTPKEQNIYVPGANEMAMRIQQGFEKVTPGSLENPSVGLVSQTRISQGAQLQQMEKDMFLDLVSGREPLSSLGAMIDKWRSAGGDQIRTELQQAKR